MDSEKLKQALQKMNHEELREFADRNGFDFYALLDVCNGSLKINSRHEQRIKQAILTSGIKSAGCLKTVKRPAGSSRSNPACTLDGKQ